MVVVIQGAGTINKGAQLMLEAIVERLGPRVSLGCQPRSADFFIRAELGLLQSTYMERFPAISSIGSNLLPEKIRTWYGLTAAKDVTGFVDASGFAFSDSFGLKGIRFSAKSAQYQAKKGIPIVMLPQAFGPFEHPEKAKWSRIMLENTKQIFVRDQVSAHMLDRLNLTTPIKVSPDFTIGLEPTPLDPICENPFAAIVPNMKLIESGTLSRPEYMERLIAYGKAAAKSGLDIVVVVHEIGDAAISQALAEHLGASIYRSDKPRELKAALGQAKLVVSSRFHAVVGGLSQAKPTIALGWSHKYRELLMDFGVEGWLDSIETSPESLVLDVLNDASGQTTVTERKRALLNDVETMWQETEHILNIPMGS